MRKKITISKTKALIILPSFMILTACGGGSSSGESKVNPPQENPSASDLDGDGIISVNDNCLNVINPDQADLDDDGLGDLCDDDIDGDNVKNNQDVFPYDPNEWSDFDKDGVGDNSDEDIDGDGYPNTLENEQGTSNFNPDDYPINFVSISPIYTEWKDVEGDITPIGDYSPEISDQTSDFVQTREFEQLQKRTRTDREGDEFSDAIRVVGETEETQMVVVTKERTVNVSLGDWNDISDCEEWTPAVEEIVKGKEFTQERECVDGEEREVSYSSDGQFLESRMEENIIDERTEEQDAVGTKTLDNDGDKLVNSYEVSKGLDPENADVNSNSIVDGDEVELLSQTIVPVDTIATNAQISSDETLIKYIKNTSVLYFHIAEMENNVNVLTKPYGNLVDDYYSKFEISAGSAIVAGEESVLNESEHQKSNFVNCVLENTTPVPVTYHGLYDTGLEIDKQSSLAEGAVSLYTKGTNFEVDYTSCLFANGQKTVDIRSGLAQITEGDISFHPYAFDSSNTVIQSLPEYVKEEIGVMTDYRYIYTDYQEIDKAAELAGVSPSVAPFNEMDLIMEYTFDTQGRNIGFVDGKAYMRLSSVVDTVNPENSKQIQYKLNNDLLVVIARDNNGNRLFEYPNINAAMESDNTNYRQTMVTELEYTDLSGEEKGAKITGTRLRIKPFEVNNMVSNEVTAPFLSGFYSGGRTVTGDAQPSVDFRTPKFQLQGWSGVAKIGGAVLGGGVDYTIEQMEYEETSQYCSYKVRYVFVDYETDSSDGVFDVDKVYGFLDADDSCETKPYRPANHHINNFNPATDNAEKLWLQY